jgi:hypothetical protein
MQVWLQFKRRDMGPGFCRNVTRRPADAGAYVKNPRTRLQLQNLQRLVNRIGPEIVILVKRRELVHPQCGIRPDAKGRQLIVNALHIGVKFHGFHEGMALQNAIIPTTRSKGQQDFSPMNIFNYLVPLAVAAVAVVLLLGLWNMLRGGSASRSQNLMRWRVVLQFAAIILIMAALWLANR